MDIKEATARLAHTWICNENEYPQIGRLASADDVASFRRKHVLSHMLKSLGKLAAADEAADHGDPAAVADREALLTLSGKMIVNILEYAQVCGIAPEELETWLDGFLKKPA